MATTIPVSTIVDVAISVSPVFPSRAGFGTLMLVTNEATGPISANDRIRTYNNIAGVAEDWASTDEVYKAASTYFSQQPKPTELKVGFADCNGTDTGTETISDALDDMQDQDQGFYGLAVISGIRTDTIALALAAWAEARIKIFMCCSNSTDIIDATVVNDLASTLKNSSYRRTTVIYSSYAAQYPEVSVFARAATVNFNQVDSTITLKFKQLPTITTENLRQSQKAALDSKNANALITVGDSIMFAESYMANGVFFDEVHGLDWLQNAIQTNVFGYLYTKPTKVPYTDKGVAAIEQQVTNALNEGVRNGLLAPGTTIDGEYLPLGYSITTIPVANINQSDVEARLYPGLSFVALGAGAIHRVQISGIFER